MLSNLYKRLTFRALIYAFSINCNQTGAFFVFVWFMVVFVSPMSGQAPGGYASGLRFWIKSSAGTYSNAGTNACTDNTAVQQWNDQSGNGYNCSQPTASLRPTYFVNASNGNPAVRFAGTHFLDATSTVNIAGNTDYSGFYVVKLTSVTAGGTTDGNGDYILDRTTATNNLFDLKAVSSGGTNRFFFQKRNDAGGNLGGPTSTTVIDNSNFQIVYESRVNNSGGNTISSIWVNGVLEDSQSNGTETTTPPLMRIGRHATNTTGGMKGDLTELIIYNNVPSTTNRQKVESYLAIKYGISLNQSTLRNYFESGGNVIYPATTTHSAYITNIAGIGRDDGSGLNQSNSKNQSSTAYVRIQNPSSLNDGDFLVWGSNNGSMTTPNAVDVDGTVIQTRLSRVWRLAEVNDVGTVDITIDLSAVPGNKNQSDLRLLIDRNGNGFADNDVAPISGTLNGNEFTVSGVTFQNGDYFTVGSTNGGSTPLPIELSKFEIVCVADKLQAKWTTLSEKNCAGFMIEKSLNAKDFYPVGQLPGAGNSSVKRDYVLPLDSLHEIHNENAYFRLNQIDVDGTCKRYPLKMINCELQKNLPVVYPNPSNGMFYIDHDASLIDAKVLDIFGRTILNVNLEQNESSFNLNQFPKGLYYLQLSTNYEVINKKIYLQ